jgi:hypothetical protein
MLGLLLWEGGWMGSYEDRCRERTKMVTWLKWITVGGIQQNDAMKGGERIVDRRWRMTDSWRSSGRGLARSLVSLGQDGGVGGR